MRFRVQFDNYLFKLSLFMKKIIGFLLVTLLSAIVTEANAQNFDPVKEYWRADANRDHRIDISDIVTMINWIAEGKTYEDRESANIHQWRDSLRYVWFPDVNKDNTVNISDIVAAINIVASGKGSGTFDCAVDDGYCPNSNHPHAIDLGIGVPVSCCNLGASYPDEHGGYYAWGETEEDPNTYRSYHVNNYPYFLYHDYQNGKSFNECWLIKETIINLTDYDGPHKKWGNLWTLPTPQLAKAIVDKCSVEYTQLYGKDGMKVTGPNGKSVFLPASGKSSYSEYLTMEALKGGFFWTSERWGEWATSLMYDPKVSEIKIANAKGSNFFPFQAWTATSIRPSYLDLSIYPSCPDNNHPHSIDLGLPSGLHWACCNVGADSPSHAGDYYRWGSTKHGIDLNEYSFPRDYDDIASTDCDVANVKWQNGWKMPTKDEMQELKDNCTFLTGYLNGEICAMVTGPNGNHIFLNYTGHYFYGVESYGSYGQYFSSTKKNGMLIYLMSVFLNTYGETRFNIGSEYGDYGTPVRPVRYYY